MSNLHLKCDRSQLECHTCVYFRELRTYHRAVRMRRGVRQALEALEPYGMYSVSPVIRERVASILEGPKPVRRKPRKACERRVISLAEWRASRATSPRKSLPDAYETDRLWRDQEP